jgi:hypothetical protein
MATSPKVRVALILSLCLLLVIAARAAYRIWLLCKSRKVVRVSANRGLTRIRHREDAKAELSRGEMWRDPFPTKESRPRSKITLSRLLFTIGPWVGFEATNR